MKYDVSYTNDIVVEVSEVENAIKHLDINKTCGMDGFLCMDSYLILCYLLCLFQLSKINVARFTVKKMIDLLH